MKRDIKVNFGILDAVVERLGGYITNCDDMMAAVDAIDALLAESAGGSIDALAGLKRDAAGAIGRYRTQASQLRYLLIDYCRDMTAIVPPNVRGMMTRADSNDTYWNIQQMSWANHVSSVWVNAYEYIYTEDGRASSAADVSRAAAINAEAAAAKRAVEEGIGLLWGLHDRVARYEEADDAFAARADELYGSYADAFAGFFDFLDDAGAFLDGMSKGILDGIVALFTETFNMVVYVAGYVLGGIVYLCTAPFGATPDFIKDYIDGCNDTMGKLLEDPMLIIEGLFQEAFDGFEASPGYAFGLLVPDIASMIAGAHGLDKLGKLGKAGRFGRFARRSLGRIPDETLTPTQQDALLNAINYGKVHGVDVNIVVTID